MKDLLTSPAAVRDGLLPCLREDPQGTITARKAPRGGPPDKSRRTP